MSQIIAICAVIGAALGIFNFVRAYLNDTERLTIAVWEGDSEHASIAVINHSHFPVTIVALGRLMGDGHIAKIVLDHRSPEQMPARIEARDARTFRLSVRDLLTDNPHGVRYCFARTALGSIATNEPRLVRSYRHIVEWLNLQPKDLS